MDSNYYGIIEMTLTFGLVTGFGVWQLVSLERDKRKQLKDKADAVSSKREE
jgi:hypothetical protein